MRAGVPGQEVKGGKSGSGDRQRRVLGVWTSRQKAFKRQRLNMIGFGMEWDSRAKRERQKVQPWKGSANTLPSCVGVH